MSESETYRVASTDLKTQYEYSNESVAINGTHNKDGNGQLTVLRGEVFAIGGGVIGNFSGYRRGTAMMYDFSGIESAYLVQVSQAVLSLEVLAVSDVTNNEEGGEA